jgi:hypothetical protein
LTEHLTVLAATVCSLFRRMWISLGLISSAISSSVTTLCFIRVAVTSAILNYLCVVLMWRILAPLTPEKRDFNSSITDARSFL